MSNSGTASTRLSAGPNRQRMVAVSGSEVEMRATASMAVSAPRSTRMLAVLPSNRARSRGCGSSRFDRGMDGTTVPASAEMLAEVATLSSQRKAPAMIRPPAR
jgi:hypothetical protein